MIKEALFVGVAAGLGEYAARKYGAKIETKAVEMKVPPALAHAGIVGGAAVAGYLLVKAIWR